MQDLQQRRTEAQDRLEQLRTARGAALLDEGKFDGNAIVDAEQELQALNDAEGEEVRRQRDEDEKKRKALLVQHRRDLAAMEGDRLAALREAEAGARQVVAGIARALAVNARMATTCHAISGDSAPLPLNAAGFVTRLAGRLSAVMASVAGHGHRLGFLEWRPAMYHERDDWAACEQKLLAPHLAPLLDDGKDKANGQ